MKFLHDAFTGIDNQTYDLGRILLAFSLFAYLVLSFLTISRFNPLDFAGGVGAILTTGGILLKLKETTEPKK